jgi:vitamin B12 transporter
MRKFFVLYLSLLLLPFCSVAQDSLEATMLREVVVSAGRTEQPLIEVPRSVTVIGEAVIKTSVYQSLGDLLNAQAGLYVVGANQTPGMNQNVFMRGSNSNQVAVLIDGVRVTDPSSPNAAIDLSEISLANVERIEVIRGSHSTMFGGAAIGGVVNLITKKNPPAGFHGDASWQGGTFGKRAWSSVGNVNLSYAIENGLYFSGSVFQQDVNGLNAIDPEYQQFTADRDDFQKTDGSIKTGFKNELWDANVSFKNTHQYTEVDNGAFADDDNYYLTFDRRLLQYYAGYKLTPAVRFSVQGSLSDSERYYENDSSRVSDTDWDKTYSSGSYFGELQTHELQFNYDRERWRTVFGAGAYQEKMFFESYFFFNLPSFPIESVTNYDTLDTRTATRYVFTQASFDLGNFNLTGGARLNHHSLAGDFLTVEFNPSVTLGALLLYGSLSTGYNAPSLYQLFDPSRGFNAHTSRGNRNLEPERSISLEVGMKEQFREGSYITFSAYKTKVTESIEYVYLWNGATPLEEIDYADDRGDTYINVGKQKARGVEMGGYARVSDRFSFQGNISLLTSQIQVDPQDLDQAYTGGHHIQLYNLGAFLNQDVRQKKVVRRPDVTAFTRFNYRPVEALGVNMTYRYTGKRFDAGYDGSLGPYGALARIDVDAYHLVDLGVTWQAMEKLSIAAKVENVLNEEYREVVGFQTRGRSLYLKLSAKF